MKQIINRPFLLALFLSLPLWIVFGNFIVALMAALLFSFLLSMANALLTMRNRKPDTTAPRPPAADSESGRPDAHPPRPSPETKDVE